MECLMRAGDHRTASRSPHIWADGSSGRFALGPTAPAVGPTPVVSTDSIFAFRTDSKSAFGT
jgi:hypothetical protein